MDGRAERDVAAMQADSPEKQMTYDTFISYRRENGLDLARRIADWLKDKGINCFIDQTEMQTGQFNEQIASVIADAHLKYFLLLFTEGAMNRDWVKKEIELAHKHQKKIIVITLEDVKSIIPTDFPDEFKKKFYWLETTERAQISRGKTFNGTLQDMVRQYMPEFKRRACTSEENKKALLLYMIRDCKRNDGEIDANENDEIEKEAKDLGVDSGTLCSLYDKVNAEWAQDEKFVTDMVGRFLTNGDRLNAEEYNIHSVMEEARKRDIPENRLIELGDKIKQKIHQNKANAEKKNLEAEKEGLAKQLYVCGSESEKRRKKCFVLTFVLLLVLLLVPLAWWYGKGAGDGEASRRMESEMEQMKAEVAQAKEDASREKAAAESSKQDAERISVAEKRAADALRARGRAEKETEEAKSKLLAANKATAAVEAARQEAEKQLAEAKAHAEKRRAEALSAIEAERTARKDAEVKSAETAAELNLAKAKAQQLEAELNLAKEKAQQLEAEKDSLQKDLDDLRRRRNAEVRDP